MSDDSLRRRLEALNREPLPTGGPALRPNRAPPTLQRSTPPRPTPVAPLPGVLQRGETVHTPAGEHLRIQLPIDDIWPGGARLVAGRQEQLHKRAARPRGAAPGVLGAEMAALVQALPDRALLLDLETCGLAGSAMFLIGLLRDIAGEPTVELLLARNYAEEAAILHSLWQRAADHDVLVTFNGKSFDWPMVMDRSVRHRVGSRPGENGSVSLPAGGGIGGPRWHHVDVLHHARRRWRRQLPNCRLQTLEQFICRRKRTGDIPGHRIPAAYAEFVRTGCERDMDAIVYHNAVDLVTLLDLAIRLAD